MESGGLDISNMCHDYWKEKYPEKFEALKKHLKELWSEDKEEATEKDKSDREDLKRESLVFIGRATCPFCNVVNRFGRDERRCPHYEDFEEVQVKSAKLLVKYYLAVFRENGEMIKIMVEEESDGRA